MALHRSCRAWHSVAWAWQRINHPRDVLVSRHPKGEEEDEGRPKRESALAMRRRFGAMDLNVYVKMTRRPQDGVSQVLSALLETQNNPVSDALDSPDVRSSRLAEP